MKELTLDDLKIAGAVFKRCVPDLTSVYVFGSGAVAAMHPGLDARLRRSVDFDFAPVGRNVTSLDARFVEQWAGIDSDFYSEQDFYIDYIDPSLLRCVPPGWQQRVTVVDLAPGLKGHCLDPHDVAYSKLWAGRPKDIQWVWELLNTGIITMKQLDLLHASNSIPEEDQVKVEKSLVAVREQRT